MESLSQRPASGLYFSGRAPCAALSPFCCWSGTHRYPSLPVKWLLGRGATPKVRRRARFFTAWALATFLILKRKLRQARRVPPRSCPFVLAYASSGSAGFGEAFCLFRFLIPAASNCDRAAQKPRRHSAKPLPRSSPTSFRSSASASTTFRGSSPSDWTPIAKPSRNSLFRFPTAFNLSLLPYRSR